MRANDCLVGTAETACRASNLMGYAVEDEPGEYATPERRTNIRFEMTTPEMTVYRPDGKPFLSFEDLEFERDSNQKRADESERRVSTLQKRLARLAELAPKIQNGRATPEDFAEFARLAAPDPV